MNPDLLMTIGAVLAFGALFAYASWRANRPVVLGKARMLPWRGIIIFAGFAAIVALVHLVNLAGFETGQR